MQDTVTCRNSMRLHHGQDLLILLLILLLKRLNLPLAVELQTLNMLPQQP